MKLGINVKLGLLAGILNCIIWYVFAIKFEFYSLSIYVYKFYTTLALTIVGTFLTIFLIRKSLGGFISFKQSLKNGVQYSLILSIVIATFNFVYHKFIVPDAIDFFISEEKKAWLNNNRTIEEVEKYINDYYAPSFGSFHTLMTSIIWGILLSLLYSAILRKKNPNTIPFSEN